MLPGLVRDHDTNRFQGGPIERAFCPPAYSIIPVIGDGKWIWRDPPEDKGYLEPREFEVVVGMRFTGRGESTDLYGTTVAPTSFPEQKILHSDLQVDNGKARLAELSDGATQLQLYVPRLANQENRSSNGNISAEAVVNPIKGLKSRCFRLNRSRSLGIERHLKQTAQVFE